MKKHNWFHSCSVSSFLSSCMWGHVHTHTHTQFSIFQESLWTSIIFLYQPSLSGLKFYICHLPAVGSLGKLFNHSESLFFLLYSIVWLLWGFLLKCSEPCLELFACNSMRWFEILKRERWSIHQHKKKIMGSEITTFHTVKKKKKEKNVLIDIYIWCTNILILILF